MTSPLDQSEVDALMAAIQDGRVNAEPGAEEAAPVLPYDLTSQDRIIRGQMPTLDSINEKVAAVFGTNLAGRTRLDVRAMPAASTLMQFGDVSGLFSPSNSVWILSLGPGPRPGGADGRGAAGPHGARGGAGRSHGAHRSVGGGQPARADQRRAPRAQEPARYLLRRAGDRLGRRAALAPGGGARRVGSPHGDDLRAQRPDDPVRLRDHRRRDGAHSAGDPLRHGRADQEVARRRRRGRASRSTRASRRAGRATCATSRSTSGSRWAAPR